MRSRGVACALFVLVCAATFGQSTSDPAFDTSVVAATYRQSHPRVVIDQAHYNFHTMDGRYRPFAELVAHDGYAVSPGDGKFTPSYLSGIDILVIANARGADGPPHSLDDAFTSIECSALHAWVRRGGRLLLIADHAPFGAAARSLGAVFGADMGKGHVFDPVESTDDPGFLLFTHDNGLLRDHPIIRGRNRRESIHRVVSFDGQSLGVPKGASALLALGKGAKEADDDQQLQELIGKSVGGRAQAIALTPGRGRIVIAGEAAMFSAQVIGDFHFGMNAPGNDDRQFVLNVMHWLSGAL
jgi:hypothetical protein